MSVGSSPTQGIMEINPTLQKNLEQIDLWQKDVFMFTDEALNMRPSEPIDELKGKPITYKDGYGREHTTILFDFDGRLVYHDLEFYKVSMFKNQNRKAFKRYRGTRYTWQQTIELTAYQRALDTFGKDSFDVRARWISITSGHGTGKTAFISTVALHFLICFFGAQIGATSNTEQQLKDIFLKELYFWKERLPEHLKSNIEMLDDMVRISGEKDWFLRARVARKEKPEALAGLHGEYVLILVDEASGIADIIFEVMKGALTGKQYIVIYTSNPTRTEGEFFDSHNKLKFLYTTMIFSSRHSPIVEIDYVQRMEDEYGADSDEVKIRVDGTFAGMNEMDDKGWIPLFAGLNVLFEPQGLQHINRAVIGVDPAGKGRDSSLVMVRDNVYLKEVLNEKTSSEPDLARKIEMIRDTYNSTSNDIGIDAFGIGARVIANIQTKMGESVNAILADSQREETKDRYATYKSELAWRFRQWVARGGIIITNNKKAWVNELEKVKYKRDGKGRIMLMSKIEFKKEYRFSPDRFDASLYTFFKDDPTMPVVLTKAQLETKDMQEWIQRQEDAKNLPVQDYSSM
jgi:hypothetical protein